MIVGAIDAGGLMAEPKTRSHEKEEQANAAEFGSGADQKIGRPETRGEDVVRRTGRCGGTIELIRRGGE